MDDTEPAGPSGAKRVTPGTEPRVPSVATDAAHELLARLQAEPQRVARYRVEEEIGRGGMGTVLRAVDREIGRRVAMKVLDVRVAERQDPDSVADRTRRFLAEAQLAGQLDHPGIAPVHELGLDAQGRVFFTMKLVRGRTLTEVLDLLTRREQGWTETRVLAVIQRVCEALAFAHARGVIHRDLKPDNVMIGRFGETYVMDWGLAHVLGDGESVHKPATAMVTSNLHTVRDTPDADAGSPLLTADGMVIGTPAFMAPEQAEGRVAELSPRTDVYAVGTLLYQLLTGQVPYASTGVVQSPRTILARVLSGPPTPVLELKPTAPVDLVAVCEKAMARRADDRYPGTMELAADLEAYLERRPVAARQLGLLHALRLRMARNRAVVVTTAVAMLALAVLGTWFLLRVAEAHQREQLVADLMTAQALVEAASSSLTPRAPDQFARTSRWAERTTALLDRAGRYREALAQGVLAPFLPDEVQRLQRLLDELTARRAVVREEMRLAERVAAEPTRSVLALWQPVLEQIRSTAHYAGIDDVAQPGLLPLRQNDAGFWQFLLLGSGDEPPFDPVRGVYTPDPGSGVVLVLLPGGELALGSSFDEANELPHRAVLAPFLLAAHEVTQGQWRRLVGNNPSRRQHGIDYDEIAYDDRHPVESISWYEAERFAALCWARMPGEDEFEYAARAKSPGERWFDGHEPTDLQGYESLRDLAFRDGGAHLPWNDGFPEHAPVGTFRPNSFGLFDVGGNVSEWTRDYYGREDAAHLGEPDADRPDALRLRVVRGSNWGEPEARLRASYRKFQRPDYCSHWLGMRLARSWMSREQVAGLRAAFNR